MARAPLPDRVDDRELTVRRWTTDDVDALGEAITRNVDHLRPWMPWIAFEPVGRDDRRSLVENWDRDWRAGGDVVLGVFVGGEVAGSTGFHRRIGPAGLEIGYWIDREHCGRGLCTRVAGLLTDLAFTVPGITHVVIPCDDANHRSARVAEKLGYRLVGRVGRPALAPAETGVHRVHRVDRGEWLSRRDS